MNSMGVSHVKKKCSVILSQTQSIVTKKEKKFKWCHLNPRIASSNLATHLTTIFPPLFVSFSGELGSQEALLLEHED